MVSKRERWHSPLCRLLVSTGRGPLCCLWNFVKKVFVMESDSYVFDVWFWHFLTLSPPLPPLSHIWARQEHPEDVSLGTRGQFKSCVGTLAPAPCPVHHKHAKPIFLTFWSHHGACSGAILLSPERLSMWVSIRSHSAGGILQPNNILHRGPPWLYRVSTTILFTS